MERHIKLKDVKSEFPSLIKASQSRAFINGFTSFNNFNATSSVSCLFISKHFLHFSFRFLRLTILHAYVLADDHKTIKFPFRQLHSVRKR